MFFTHRYSLIWFYGISTIVGHIMPNPFYTYKQFYFKQFSLAGVQFFVYTQLKVKTVLFQIIQFIISIISNMITNYKKMEDRIKTLDSEFHISDYQVNWLSIHQMSAWNHEFLPCLT